MIKSQGGVFGRNPSFNEVEAAEIGIGVSDPLNLLHVAGLPKTLGASKSVAWMDDTSPLALGVGGGIAFRGVFNTAGDLVPMGGIQGKKENANTGNANGSVSLFASAGGSLTEVMQGQSSGNVRLPIGNLVIGTSGKGIDFSATSGTGTSELFNDYEEGAWTPTFSVEFTTAPTVTSAQYTKIGRQVTVTMLATGGVVTAGGSIGGLPFTSNSSQGAGAYGGNSDTTESLQGTVGQSASSITNIPARTLTGDTWQITATYFT